MRLILLASIVLLYVPTCVRASGLPKPIRAFIEAQCLDCHDADSARAGFRIDLLTDDFTAGNNADLWKEVMDKINSGADAAQEEAAARMRRRRSPWLRGWRRNCDETTKAAQGAGGRVPMRRLNRVEYANTVRDLFSLEEGFARRIEKELPADGKVGGFDRGAASLFMDEGQLDQYMAVADLVLDEARFQRTSRKSRSSPGTRRRRSTSTASASPTRTSPARSIDDNPTPGFVANLKEPLSMIPIDGFEQWNAKEKRYVPHGPFDWTHEERRHRIPLRRQQLPQARQSAQPVFRRGLGPERA